MLGVETCQGPFQPELLFQPDSPFSGFELGLCCSRLWVCKWLMMPCYPVTSNFCGCKFPIFQPSYYGNLCILSVCCQVLREVLLIHKDLFKAILSEAWRKFSHRLPS